MSERWFSDYKLDGMKQHYIVGDTEPPSTPDEELRCAILERAIRDLRLHNKWDLYYTYDAIRWFDGHTLSEDEITFASIVEALHLSSNILNLIEMRVLEAKHRVNQCEPERKEGREKCRKVA